MDVLSSALLNRYSNPSVGSALGVSQRVDTGNWLQRTFDSGKLDMLNSAYAAQADRDFTYAMSQYSNDFNAEQAQKQRDFEERMSNTAYSRSVNQLRELGMNPYLALTSGMAASTPSGASASAVGGSASSHTRAVGAYGSQRLLSSIAATVGMIASSGASLGMNAALSAYSQNQEALKRRRVHYGFS